VVTNCNTPAALAAALEAIGGGTGKMTRG
jgi:hypothetical protein